MRWVDQAAVRPYRCALIPYVGNGSGHQFLDTGQDLDLEHVYVSDVACEAIARALGWVPPSMVAQKETENAVLRAENAELKKKADLGARIAKGTWAMQKDREAINEMLELEKEVTA